MSKDGMTIFKINVSDSLDIICYEPDFCIIGVTEKKLCHYYKIKPVDLNIVEKIDKNILNYIVSLNEIDKKIEFYNFEDKNLIIINYSELKEINCGQGNRLCL